MTHSALAGRRVEAFTSAAHRHEDRRLRMCTSATTRFCGRCVTKIARHLQVSDLLYEPPFQRHDDAPALPRKSFMASPWLFYRVVKSNDSGGDALPNAGNYLASSELSSV